jgi:hypothetical protein
LDVEAFAFGRGSPIVVDDEADEAVVEGATSEIVAGAEVEAAAGAEEVVDAGVAAAAAGFLPLKENSPARYRVRRGWRTT